MPYVAIPIDRQISHQLCGILNAELHITLVHFSVTANDREADLRIAKALRRVADRTCWTRVVAEEGFRVFGTEEDPRVVRMLERTAPFDSLQASVQRAVTESGGNVSTTYDWAPHITVGHPSWILGADRDVVVPIQKLSMHGQIILNFGFDLQPGVEGIEL